MSIGGSSSAKTTSTKESKDTDKASASRQTSQLSLDQTAIEKIIGDVLGSESGLASIFGGEQTAGLFDSSVAAQASGDLVANLIGELAKVTGTTVTTSEELSVEQQRAKARTTELGVEANFTL